jgi:hypothetical protein
MSIFGWRLTNKKPEVESDKVKEIHALLKGEVDHRQNLEKIHSNEQVKLKKKVVFAEGEAKKARAKQINDNKSEAIIHLRAAERYENMMDQCKGSRADELKAIVSARVEKALNLGFEVQGSISKTINRLM